jgi:2-hydroxychromene-2-carboxylate isomerase
MRFSFDYISPYAYLAWTQIHELAALHGRTVQPVPVLFAGLLKAWGHKGPAEIPPKKRYVGRDIARNARVLGQPVHPPPEHPFNPLLSLRVSGLPMSPSKRNALVNALFGATWASGEGVTDPRVVERIANSCGVPDAVERASAQEAKDTLRVNTEEAVQRGLWGVPTIEVDGEVFWGLDSLPHLDRFLQGIGR